MSKGTILYIGGFELPDKNAAAHRVVNNSKILREIGYEVVLFGVHKDKITKFKKEYLFNFTAYSLPYPITFNKKLKYFYSIRFCKDLIKKLSNVKFVICYNMPSLFSIRLIYYCKANDIKIISDTTEWSKNSLKGNFLLGALKRADSFFRMRIVNKYFDGIIVISKYLDDYYKKNGIKTLKVPPLVDTEDQKWKLLRKRKHNKVKFVYAGGAFSTKDKYVKDRLDIVIQALFILKKEGFDFSFDIVGCGSDEFKNFYPELSGNIDFLDENIRFYGKIEHLKAIIIIKSSDFSIFLRDENIITKAGFPTKFVESISCGVPVLTNSNSNIVEYINNGKYGFLINSNSLDDVFLSLKFTLSLDPNKISRIKEKTYNSRLFDYRNYLKAFEVFFNNYNQT